MSIALYMDVHVPAPISRALLRRQVDVLTAQADGATGIPDDKLLDRATALNRALFTRLERDDLRACLEFAADRVDHQWYPQPKRSVKGQYTK